MKKKVRLWEYDPSRSFPNMVGENSDLVHFPYRNYYINVERSFGLFVPDSYNVQISMKHYSNKRIKSLTLSFIGSAQVVQVATRNYCYSTGQVVHNLIKQKII